MDITEIIASLPQPAIFAEKAIEDIVAENVEILKGLNPDWVPVESDPNMMQIEAFSYKEKFLRDRFNAAIKKMLPHYCEGDDLDNFIFGFYGGETRLEGSEPTAVYKFEPEEALGVDITVPKGLLLSDGADAVAYVDEDITILSGELSAQGKVKLDQKIQTSSVKTEIVVSTYPYVVNVSAQGDFEGGTDPESDDAFLERAMLGLYQYSTAGGEKAYIYYAKTADSRAYDVKVLNPQARYITVVVLSSSAEAEVLANIDAMLNDEKIQAFDDVVTVQAAVQKAVSRDVDVYLYDLATQGDIATKIEAAFKDVFKIGEALPYSNIISKLHTGGVYKVVLTDNTDITANEDEYIDLTLNITYKAAEL